MKDLINELLRAELRETHEMFAWFRIDQDDDMTPEQFANLLQREVSGAVEAARWTLSRYQSGVLSATVDEHKQTRDAFDARDKSTGETVRTLLTRHEGSIKLICSGPPCYLPRAKCLRAMGKYLLLDDVKWIEIGNLLVTPQGKHRVVMVDTLQNIVKLDGDAGEKCFEVFTIGDHGAPKEESV